MTMSTYQHIRNTLREWRARRILATDVVTNGALKLMAFKSPKSACSEPSCLAICKALYSDNLEAPPLPFEDFVATSDQKQES